MNRARNKTRAGASRPTPIEEHRANIAIMLRGMVPSGSLKRVAELSGVSSKTVGTCLGGGVVKPANKEAILAACRRIVEEVPMKRKKA